MDNELVQYEEESQELLQAARAELQSEGPVNVPILKLAQPMTKEVTDGDAKGGDFINVETGENHGPEIDFVVAGFEKGRWKTDERTQQVFLAFSQTVPESWRGDPYIGKPFSEHPDAEEQFKAAVNAKERDWGKGPPISTTYNFWGYVLGSDIPVRFTLMRSQAKVGDGWRSKLLWSPAPWDRVWHLSTEARENKSGKRYYAVKVEQGPKTSPEDRQRAVQLAQARLKGRAQLVGDETAVSDEPGAPSAPPSNDGGLDV